VEVKKFQGNLRKIRQYAGIEQQELASAIGVSRQTINNIETGKSVLVPHLYEKILAYIKQTAVGGKGYLIPFLKFLQNEENNLGWREIEMEHRLNKVFISIDKMKTNGLNRQLLQKIKENRGIYCKTLAYSYHLWNQMHKEVGFMLIHLSDLIAVNRYFLKPYLEDYMNFCNLTSIGEDYTRAMHIHFLGEDRTVQNKFINTYTEQLGVDLALRTDLHEKQEKHLDRIQLSDIRNLVKEISIHEDYNLYFFPMNARKRIYNNLANDDYERKQLWNALYDYSNNYGHLNLRFLRQSDQDENQYITTLLTFIEETLTLSTQELLRLFRLHEYSLQLDEMVREIYDNVILDVLDSDDDIELNEITLNDDEDTN